MNHMARTMSDPRMEEEIGANLSEISSANSDIDSVGRSKY